MTMPTIEELLSELAQVAPKTAERFTEAFRAQAAEIKATNEALTFAMEGDLLGLKCAQALTAAQAKIAEQAAETYRLTDHCNRMAGDAYASANQLDAAKAEIERLRSTQQKMQELYEEGRALWAAEVLTAQAQHCCDQERIAELEGLLREFKNFAFTNKTFVYPLGSLQKLDAALQPKKGQSDG